MKKVLKITGITLLVLLVLIISLPFMFKGKIIDIVKEQANANLNAKVDFGEFDMGLISTFPNFNFSINNVTVDGVDKFEGTQLANIKNLSLRVDLMSVISGDEIKIKSIYIDEPTINAIVLADTSANWDIAKATEEIEEEVVEEEASPFKLNLQDLTIKSAKINYEDATMNLTTSIVGLNFNLSGDMTQDVTDLVTKTMIEELNLTMDNVAYFKKANVEADAIIKADLANSKFTFTDNQFRLNELFLGFDGWVAIFEDNDDIDMDITFNAQKTDFKNILSLVPAVFMTDFASVKTEGKLALNGFAKGKMTETALPAFGLDLLVEKAMFKYPDLPKAVNNIHVDLAISNPGGSEDNTLINLKRFYMEMAGNPVEMKMKLSTPISDPNIDANLIAKLDLASVKDVMPMEAGDEMNGKINADVTLKGKMSSIDNERYEEFEAKGSFGITDMLYKSDSLPYDVLLQRMTLNFSPQFVELANFDAQIGKSDMHANGKIENFIAYVLDDSTNVLTGNFMFNSTLMDLNEFMSEEEVAATEGTEEVAEEPLAVVEVPKNIDFSLTSTLNKVIYDNMEITDMKGLITVKDQKVSMKDVGMNLLGGKMMMSGFYETTNPAAPGFNFDMAIQDFDVATVVSTFNTIETMAPYAKNAKGRFNTSMIVSGVLDKEMMPDMNSLTGNGDMLTKNIKVEDVKAMNQLADALKNESLRVLEVNDAKIKYAFKDGRVTIEPFDVKLGKTIGTMSGSNGFDQTIDYKMTLKTPIKELGAGDALNKLNSQAAGLGMTLKSAETVSVDVLIKGTFDAPKVSVSLKDAVGNIKDEIKEQVKEKITEQVDKAKEEAKKKAREQADKLIAEAEKNAQKIRDETKSAADKVRAEADKQANDLIAKAGGNPLKKIAAEKAAQKIKDEAEKKAVGIENEGNKRADALVSKAKQEADDMMQKVEEK
ncbi:MAG: hypothetical protein CMD31_04245 [Flavobacteriales bacterium]|nr:hypothetical protein [Flavobacteriales bacterium]|tara:strand:- start:36286 stop:39105 length:2820 start_codon:yes stop_codon:yes gene_type:complete